LRRLGRVPASKSALRLRRPTRLRLSRTIEQVHIYQVQPMKSAIMNRIHRPKAENTTSIKRCFSLSILVLPAALAGALLAAPAATAHGKMVLGRPTRAAAINSVGQSEELKRVQALPSEDERIAELEKLVLRERGPAVDGEFRQALMKEYALRGEQHLREGSPDKAAKDFKSVMRVAPAEITDPIFDQFVFPMPIAMNTFGYRTEAAELMRSFERRFANNPSRLIQIGFFYVQIEAPVEAVRVLERVVTLAPNDHRSHNSLGTAYLVDLRLDDAETEFKKALDLDPTDEYANLNLGNLARARGDYDKGIEYYRAQLKLKPLDEEAQAGMALSLLALGRDEQAERMIASASELGQQDYRFFTELAYFYATRKKYGLAREMVEKAAMIEPRYAWVHITKANIDALEGKSGDALTTMIIAQKLGTFPTLTFELAKQLMSVDGYDQATEVLGKSFQVTEGAEFQALLGGASQTRSSRLDLLLDRERQASLYLNIQLTTPLQYRLAESLLLIHHYLTQAVAARNAAESPKPKQPAGAKRPAHGTQTRAKPAQSTAASDSAQAAQGQDAGSQTRPRRVEDEAPSSGELSAGKDAALPGVKELLPVISRFATIDDGRQAYRMIWVARALVDKGIAVDAAIELAKRAIAQADSATEPEGSMKDAPLLDRAGRKAVFLGRAEDIYGWGLLKEGDVRGAIYHLSRSAATYPENGERKEVLWRLAIAMQGAGDEKRALEYYIAGYDPESPVASVRHDQIAALYKKLNGSLNGLEDRLKPESR
jgi:tetratricopeptide (TPR) repeat protein